MALKAVVFAAIMLVTLTLVPVGAHFFELPHKIGMTQEHYFTVQEIYRGWALFGIPMVGAVPVTMVLAFMLRAQAVPFRLAVITVLCLLGALTIFFVRIYPANQATQNWTVVPADWMEWREQWEYSHAANAILIFAGWCALVTAALVTRYPARRDSAQRYE